LAAWKKELQRWLRKWNRVLSIAAFFMIPSMESHAQVLDIAAIVKAAVNKVIVAVDLEIQRWQTGLIQAQDAQKVLENSMAQQELEDISSWVQQERDLYAEYYNELWTVKHVISGYDKVKLVVSLQAKIASEWQAAYALFQQDKHFTASELSWMYNVYSGILGKSVQNLDQLLMVLTAATAEMTDDARMKIIDDAAAAMQKNYNDLKQFHAQNIQLSLQRGIQANDVETVRKLYGLE
jgi:hypothetical protein